VLPQAPQLGLQAASVRVLRQARQLPTLLVLHPQLALRRRKLLLQLTLAQPRGLVPLLPLARH
jgi:hypothetical protein